MGFPNQRPPASGGYQDDATIPDSGSYLDDLSPVDYGGSAGDLTDRFEDTADEAYDDDDHGESDEHDELGDDELYDEGTEFDPAGNPRQAGRDSGMPRDSMN
jgi:hypothetical protein